MMASWKLDDVVPADATQKETAFQQVFDVWPCGATIEEHLQWRLNSVQHQRAVWYVGLFEGEVACSLGAYPLDFQIDRQRCSGFAIGAVHTDKPYRGRGFAAQMIQAVEQRRRSEGAQVAMLYSDIAPDYYRRLGYQVCDSHELHAPAKISPSELSFRLRTDWTIAELDSAYRDSLAGSPFWIDRDEDYWKFLNRRDGGRAERWEVWRRRELVGNAQTTYDAQAKRLHLTDYAFAPAAFSSSASEDAFWNDLAAALANLAAERQCSIVAGWAPRFESLESGGLLRCRSEEITMIKSLNESLNEPLDDPLDEAMVGSSHVDAPGLSESHRAACDRLREIYHV